MKKISVLLLALFATVVRCQEANVDDESSIVTADEESGKEKRGISLNLGSGLESYGYLGQPSYSRGLSRGYSTGYAPMTEYGYDGVNYGIGSQNFAGGYQGYQGYNSPAGNYPYSYGGYPTSYSYLRQYNTPVQTNPYGGIGTVYPYRGSQSGAYGNTFGSAYGGALNGGAGYNRLGGYENNYNGYNGYY